MNKLTMQDRAAIATSDFDPYGPDKEPFMEGYMVGATEQDKIAREEERELCRQICRDWIADYLEGEDMDSKSIDDAVKEFDIKFSKAIKLDKI